MVVGFAHPLEEGMAGVVVEYLDPLEEAVVVEVVNGLEVEVEDHSLEEEGKEGNPIKK